MALTNAERQRLWRERRNRLAKLGEEVERRGLDDEPDSESRSRKLRNGQDHDRDSDAETAQLEERVLELELENNQLKIRLQKQERMTREVGNGPDPERVKELDKYLEELFELGTRNDATASPAATLISVGYLERALVAAGVMPPSKRTTNPQGHVRTLMARQARALARAYRLPPEKEVT